MFTKIYIHIGIEKTGSSYLQNALEKLSTLSALKNTSYPILTPIGDDQQIQSGNALRIAIQLSPDLTQKFCKTTIKNLTQELIDHSDPSKKNLLISSEIFSSAHPARLDYFVKLLSEFSKSVEFLAFWRTVDSWCYSYYNQQIKRHALADHYNDAFLENACEKLIQRIVTTTQSNRITHHFSYKNNGQLISLLDFLNEDTNLNSLFTERNINRSLTEFELNFLREINATYNNKELSRRISDRWIYETPNIKNRTRQHSHTDIFNAFCHAVSTHAEHLSTPSALSVLCRIMNWEGEENTATTTYEPHELATKTISSALDEIKKISQIKNDIKDYTDKLKTTNEHFDPVHYLIINEDILDSGIDPHTHYELYGQYEGRQAYFIANTTHS